MPQNNDRILSKDKRNDIMKEELSLTWRIEQCRHWKLLIGHSKGVLKVGMVVILQKVFISKQFRPKIEISQKRKISV